MNEKINNNDVSKYRYVFATYRSHVWNDENRVIMKNNNVIMYIASIYFSMRNKSYLISSFCQETKILDEK